MSRLTEKEIAASLLRSVQKEDIMDCLHQFRVIFTTPESLFDTTTKRPRNQFVQQAANHQLCLVAINEGHQIYSWKTFWLVSMIF